MKYVSCIDRLFRVALLAASGFHATLPTSPLVAQEALTESAAPVATATLVASQVVSAEDEFAYELKTDRLTLMLAQQPIGEFVFSDEKILRPYFSQLKTPSGIQVTRNQPPLPGSDAVDHDTMHPGCWLGFGDINGADFWRNRGTIEHLRFTQLPVAESNQLSFATESELIAPNAQRLGKLVQFFKLSQQVSGWLIVWEATFYADAEPLIFGDQEEMGCGVRVATALTEKNGGVIRNAGDQTTAAETWGKAAQWCDYSGHIDQQEVGLTLMAAPNNFREPWWHNRDYGLMVANPFGRSAMKQGAASQVRVEPGQALRLCFGAFIHEGNEIDLRRAYRDFEELESSLHPK